MRDGNGKTSVSLSTVTFVFDMLATWSEDIKNLTPALIVLVVFACLYYVRQDIKRLIGNATKLRVQVPAAGEFEMSADSPDRVDQRAAGQEEEAPDDEPEKKDEAVEPVVTTAGASASSGGDKPDEDAEQDEDLDQLRNRVTDAIREKDDGKSRALFDRLQKREGDSRRRKDDLGFFLWVRFLHNMQPDALEKLDELAADPEITVEARIYRGWARSFASDTIGAAEDFALARDAATDEETKANAISYRANALNKAGEYDKAVGELEDALREFETPETRGRLWSALADVYGEHDKHQLRALALQQALEVTPGDAKLRFSAGWAYSNADEELFAPAVIHHYRAALRFAPDYEAARNNLGVAYKRSDLSILGVEEYRRASEEGNTLAAANLAYLYLNAGFAEEAEAIVTNAAENESPHPNVAKATAAIATAREDQEEKRNHLSSRGEQQAVFLGRYAEARIRQSAGFTGKWRFQDGKEVEVTENADEVVGDWMVRKTKWNFKGTAYGSAARLVLSEMEYYTWMEERKESGFRKRAEAFAYLTVGGNSLELMEVKDAAVTFRTLQRIEQPTAAAA